MTTEKEALAVTELFKMLLSTSTGTALKHSKVSVALLQLAAAVMLS
jgi:hypothetical protein